MQATDSSWILRATALKATAAIVTSLGNAVLPILPRLVPTVLSAAAAANEQLAAPEEDLDMDAADRSSPEPPAQK